MLVGHGKKTKNPDLFFKSKKAILQDTVSLKMNSGNFRKNGISVRRKPIIATGIRGL